MAEWLWDAVGPAGERRAAMGRLQMQQAGFSPGGFHILKQDFTYIGANERTCNPWARKEGELNLPEGILA